MSWNVSRSLSPHLRGFVASVDDHDGFGDFVCEVLEDAYQRGFVSEGGEDSTGRRLSHWRRLAVPFCIRLEMAWHGS
jgi:hypothetical protein